MNYLLLFLASLEPVKFIAQVATSVTPVNILFGAVSSLTAALIALYKDCRSDRAKLWEHVERLEERLGIPPGRQKNDDSRR